MDQDCLMVFIQRLLLLIVSLVALPSGVLLLKSGSAKNKKKKIALGVVLIWAAILAGSVFVKMVGKSGCGC